MNLRRLEDARSRRFIPWSVGPPQGRASLPTLRLSIRHLLILTFVVAWLVAIEKGSQPNLPHGERFFELFLFVVLFSVVGVIPVWFVLATKRPLLYGTGMVAVVTCAGYGRLASPLCLG